MPWGNGLYLALDLAQIERDRESGGIDLTEYRREVGEIGLLTMLDLKTGGTPEDMEVEQ
jgi:hypothetical protein